MFTLNDLLRWRAELHPEHIALVDERDDMVTYRGLHRRSLDCALRWQERGVSSGDVVAVLDTSSVGFFVNLFGLARLGAVPALLNWRLTAVENRDLLSLIEPVAVAAGSELVERLPPELPMLRVSLDEAGPQWPLEADGALSMNELPVLPSPASPFALGFSSGTTGLPKGIPMRHASLARSTMVDAAEALGMERGSRQLLVAPTFHLAGLSNTMMGLARGAEIHLRAGFDPDAVLDDIERLRIEYMTAVPAMFRAMVLTARSRAEAPDTSSMREMSYGASPIPVELLHEVMQLFPGARLRQFYGMTEIAGALTTLAPQDHDPASPHLSSAGRVNAGFEVRLVDRFGADVEDGRPGEVLIRGDSVMDGYWRNPAATAEVLHDGWFASGDIATRSNGYLTIMDRAKDMIVTGGENVYPAEVEADLYRHPDVVDAAVIGVPDETHGERVHAVVVCGGGAKLDLDALQAHCRASLAGYKIPRSLELVDELPRNATGKILKRELREPYWGGRERAV